MKHHRRARLALALTTATIAATAAIAAPAEAAAPVAGPEQRISTSRPGSTQRNAQVAWNGSVYLVVWEEWFANGHPAEIYGARVSADGVLLDPQGFIVSTGGFDDANDPQITPAVAAASNGNFMVVWVNDTQETYTDLDAAIVGGNGSIVRPEWPFRWVDNDQRDPAIAWNGSRFLVTWQDGPDPSDPDIFAARVFADGRSYDGCSYEACLEDEFDWPGIPIRATNGEIEGSFQTKPTITATQDSRFFISWEDTETATASDIRGSRFQLGAAMDDPPLTVSGGPAAQIEPDNAANGSNVLTVWTDRRGATGRNVWGDASLLGDGADFQIGGGAGAQYEPAVTTRGTGYLVAWTDTRNGNADVYTTRVSATGAVSEPAGVGVAASAAAEYEPALAAGSGNRQLLVYTKSSTTGGPDRVMFRLIS